MEAETKKIVNYSILIAVVIGIGVGVAMLLKYLKTQKAAAADVSQLTADQRSAKIVSAQTGLDQGRLSAIEGVARSLYQEIVKSYVYVSSAKCVSLLNSVQSADEMKYLCVYYNNSVSDPPNAHNLKADVDAHVIGMGTSADQITYYSDMA